jgi:transcriptional regulator with XRE-family HTH domain
VLQVSELAMITGDQIRQARKLLGWHRGQIAIRARGITGNTVGKAEGAYPGKQPTPEQLAEIRAVLEAAGVEFTDGARVRLKSPAPPRAL